MIEEYDLNYMTDSEIKDLLGYEGVECEIVRFRRTDDGYLTENNKNLSIQQICNNAHFINGENGVIIYEETNNTR